MEQHYKNYLIAGSAIPGPPNSGRYWCAQGSILKIRPNNSVVEVARLNDNGITFDLAGVAEWYGMELCRIAVDDCLPSSG